MSSPVAPSSRSLDPPPTSVRLQRALLRWVSHSRFVSVLSQVTVLALKGVPVLSLLVVARRTWRLSRLLQRLHKNFLVVAAKTFAEAWALLELIFWFYFHFKKRSMEARRAYQPAVLWKKPGERRNLLHRFLANIDHIHEGDVAAGGRHGSHEQPPTWGSERPAMRRFLSCPSVENFLRYYDESEEEDVLHDAHSKAEASLPRLPSSKSVENILQCREGAHRKDPKELLCLKHLELCTWFQRLTPEREPCGSVEEIRRGNIEEWILSYWFDGAESSQLLTEQESTELRQLIEDVETWAGLPLAAFPWQGYNTQLRCFRLRNDPFPAVHRPLFVYGLTAFWGPLFGHRALQHLGFRPYRSGSSEYWFRPPHPQSNWHGGDVSGRPRIEKEWHRPVVFCHGIGVGPTMCLSFLQLLAQGLGEAHPVFLVDMAPISMRFADDVPGAREFAANIVDMLEVWGFKQAHFVGHSFGSFLLAWMLRYQRASVERCTFIDPVCFLLLKTLVEANQLQVKNDARMDTMEMGIKYFVLTELFVCNFVCRCFFWEESQLDMRDLEDTDALLVLEADDSLVPTHSVQRLVLAEMQRRCARVKAGARLETLWVEGQPHAGFLVDAAANRDVHGRLLAFHQGSD